MEMNFQLKVISKRELLDFFVVDVFAALVFRLFLVPYRILVNINVAIRRLIVIFVLLRSNTRPKKQRTDFVDRVEDNADYKQKSEHLRFF